MEKIVKYIREYLNGYVLFMFYNFLNWKIKYTEINMECNLIMIMRMK